MADTTATTSIEDEAPTTGPDTSSEEVEDQTGESEESEETTEDEGDQPALTPEQLEAELKSVRQEAAQRRIENRELKEKLANAKTPEEFAALQEEVATLTRSNLIKDVATEFKLPKELQEVLKGETEEELKAHAKVLAQFVPADEEVPPFLGGGLDPDEDADDDESPAALAKQLRRRRF